MTGRHTRFIVLAVLATVMLSAPVDAQQPLADLRESAEQGDAVAQYNLGVRYADGEGVPENAREAVRWYRLAAEQGDVRAQYNTGHAYRNGEGVPQDDVEAVRWWRLGAEQGFASAQLALGIMYGVGRGAQLDLVEAHMWSNLAASRLSGEQRERAVKARDMVSEEMTFAQVTEAQRLAREWDLAHLREP